MGRNLDILVSFRLSKQLYDEMLMLINEYRLVSGNWEYSQSEFIREAINYYMRIMRLRIESLRYENKPKT
jgi:hypothetical protein